MDNVFLQFYYNKGDDNYTFLNGFSDTWNFCKSKGDFEWIYFPYNSMDELKVDADISIPIKKGNVYASILVDYQIEAINNISLEYPDVNFIIGGPGTIHFNEKNNNKLNKNILIYKKSVENYFGIDDFSCEWGIELPKHILKNTLTYNYTIDLNCYWKKCVFCRLCKTSPRRRPLDHLKTKFNKIYKESKKEIVHLGTLSLTNHLIENWFSKITIEKDVMINTYIKTDEKTTRSLRKNISDFIYRNGNQATSFIVGIEFLTDRMLKIINKGFTVREVGEFCSLVRSYDISIHPSFIVGWPQLIEKDIVELEKNIKLFPKGQNTSVFCLGIVKGVPLEKKFLLPPGQRVLYPILNCNEEIRQLNFEALEILNKHLNVVNYKTVKYRLQFGGV